MWRGAGSGAHAPVRSGTALKARKLPCQGFIPIARTSLWKFAEATLPQGPPLPPTPHFWDAFSRKIVFKFMLRIGGAKNRFRRLLRLFASEVAVDAYHWLSLGKLLEVR